MISIGVIAVVMAAVTPFLVSSISLTNSQRGRQIAVELAGEAIEEVRLLKPSALVSLPASAPLASVNGLPYALNREVETCYRPVGGDQSCRTGGAPGDVPFVRVVVGVTWRDRHCDHSLCTYRTSTLISTATTNPLFTSGATS
jgi:type II secretory pathway pseudopilin PulG